MQKKLQLKLSHKALILIAIPLAFEILFVAILVFALKRAELEIWRERHSTAVLSESNTLLKSVMDSGLSLYMYETAGSDTALERYKELARQIPMQINRLKALLRDSPNQNNSLERIKRVGNRAVELLSRGSEIIADSHAARRLGEERQEMESMLSELSTELRSFVRDQEKAEQVDPQSESRARLVVIYCLAAGIFFNIFLALSLAVYFNRGTTGRLLLLMENTERLSKNKPLHGRVGGGDEIARLDAVFHDMAEALDEASKRKQEIVAMVSHDLRSPLSSVQASLSMLSEGVFGELPDRAFVEVVGAEANISRLINLINELLDFEKLDAGQLVLSRVAVRVDKIFERASDSVAALAALKKLRIDCLDSELEVYADEDRIVQVLVNLLANAIKFSPENSRVILEALAVENEMVELTVTDEGSGIPESFRGRLFQRFQQFQDESGSAESRGTGLGLANCRMLVELHGGSVGVLSEDGKGSRFWFRLPSAKPASLN